MAITNGYATLAEAKYYMTSRGLTMSVDTNEDTVIEDLIEAASRYIDKATGRKFWVDTNDTTRYYTTDDPEVVFIDDYSSITSVTIDYAEDRTYSVILAATDWDAHPFNATTDGVPITWLKITPNAAYSFTTVDRGVKIIGKTGWAAVPDAIKTACLGIVQNAYSDRSGQASAGNVTVTSAGVVIRPQDVPAFAAEIIKSFRRMV